MKILAYLVLTTSTINCYGLRNLTEPGVLCRAGHRGSQRLGVCKDISQCRGALYDGFCRNGLGVCCFEEYKCGGITGDSVSYFQNPEFPSAIMDGSLCSHIVKIKANVCSVRLDFLNFQMSGGGGGGTDDDYGGGHCNRDWFSIIGANDGSDVTGTLCGHQSGLSISVPVKAGQNLILAAAVQSVGRAMFNIQVTMVRGGCSQDQQHVLNTPACGLLNTRSGRQFFLDQSGFQDGEEVRRRRRARNRRSRTPANRLTYWTKSHSPGRLRKVSAESQPWLYQIMSASRLLCVGTAISHHFVLTTAQCVLSRPGPGTRGDVKYLQQVGSQTFISLHRVVIHHQWALGWDLALIQTNTRLSHFICLPTSPLPTHQLRALQVGFKLSNLDRQSDHLKLFYQNITFPSQQPSCQEPGCTGHPDLHKWVPGSLLETQTRFGSAAQMVGIVSGKISAGSGCSPSPWLVRVDTEKSIQWIVSVTSENVAVSEVL